MQRVKTFVSLFLTIYPFLRKLPIHARYPFFTEFFIFLFIFSMSSTQVFPTSGLIFSFFHHRPCALEKCQNLLRRIWHRGRFTDRINVSLVKNKKCYQTPTLWFKKKKREQKKTKKGNQNYPSLGLVAAFQFAQFSLMASFCSCLPLCLSALPCFPLCCGCLTSSLGRVILCPLGAPEWRTMAAGQGCCSSWQYVQQATTMMENSTPSSGASDCYSSVFIFAFYPQAKSCPNSHSEYSWEEQEGRRSLQGAWQVGKLLAYSHQTF